MIVIYNFVIGPKLGIKNSFSWEITWARKWKYILLPSFDGQFILFNNFTENIPEDEYISLWK